MTVYENACDCSLCQGKRPDLSGVDRERIIDCGGRHPIVIVLDEGEEVRWEMSSGYLNQDPPKDKKLVGIFPASVHGCWKLVKNQAVWAFK